VLGAETLGSRAEPGRRLLQRFADDEYATDPVGDLQRGDLVANHFVRGVGAFSRNLVERVVADEAIDATALVLQLAHRLFEGAPFHADQIGDRHAHIGEEDLAEMTIGRHVLDRPHFDPGSVHRHDDFADTGVRRTLLRRPTDQVTELADFAEACPDLLAVDDELVALAHGSGLQTCEIAAGVGLAHSDAPRRFTGDDARKEGRLLIRGAVGQQRRTHLAIGEP